MGAIRQMRYCTGNVSFSYTYSNNETKSVNQTLLMPALDQNKVFVVPFADKISNGPFSGQTSGSSYLSNVQKIDDGVKLTYHSANTAGGSNVKTHTFTYQLYLIEFY